MNPLIDKILFYYKDVLADDYSIYRNHVLRIYSFMLLLDADKKNYDKYAIAAVFHDVGIWTNSFDYLEPSIKLLEDYLKKQNRVSWIEEISLMIRFHHKMSEYKGEFHSTVETFRKADWIDISMGFILFGMKKEDYKNTLKLYPNSGFHLFLIKQFLMYFRKHPLKPLPMFKW